MALKDHKGLKIVYWNTQSQFHKQQEAVQLIQQNDLDILITLETCFKEDITDNFIAITTKTDNNMEGNRRHIWFGAINNRKNLTFIK